MQCDDPWPMLLSFAKAKNFRVLDVEWLKEFHREKIRNKPDPLWEKKENDPWQKRKATQAEENKFQLLASQFTIRPEDWVDEQGAHTIKLLSR